MSGWAWFGIVALCLWISVLAWAESSIDLILMALGLAGLNLPVIGGWWYVTR